jgi:[protein-PII] uridylyltransferase
VTEHFFTEAEFAEGFLQANPIAAIKRSIAHENAQLKQRFHPQQSPTSLLNEKADFIDNLLSACWKHFLAEESAHQSLIATGGYGRSELFPHSDIDILIVLNQDFTDKIQDGLSAFSNFLWDIGLKPGLRTCDSLTNALLLHCKTKPFSPACWKCA